MNEISEVSLLNQDEPEYGDSVTLVKSARNEMIEAADQVILAAREARCVDAERVLQAMLELLKAARGGDTKTA